jgi:predicted PolB exonuclease-like 3'-5' exonuclease
VPASLPPTRPSTYSRRDARHAGRSDRAWLLDTGGEGIDGSEVERYSFLEGRIKEIADYCEADVVNTYRVWLRYELFRGRLSEREHQASERALTDFIAARANAKMHLNRLVQERTA